MENVLMHICKICKNRVPFESLHYDDKGDSLLCQRCFDKRPVVRDRPKAQTPLEKSGRSRVMCNNCNYKFYLNPKVKPQCPNCGKYSVEEAMEAQDFVNRAVGE